ncbi:MAG: HAD family phosphatase [Burkholderiales bacterium]|nr:HAD family phosphatase [Burkholderiales bacterium]
MSVEALLFDLDGTLIDSMPHHHTAWVEWHARRGLKIDADSFFVSTAGRSNDEIFADMLPGTSAAEIAVLVDEKETLYREYAAPSLALIAGAEVFVQRAKAAGFRLAVCTASTPKNMALAFQRFGIDGWVETVVSPADGLRGKPHPDIFLEAARRLGIAPGHCVVFEDAPLGVEGARRAGMKAVALTTTLPASAFAPFDNLLAIAADFTTLALPA